jgi:serine/threonine protein kinase
MSEARNCRPICSRNGVFEKLSQGIGSGDEAGARAMIQEGDPNAPKPVRSLVLARHPRIADEIKGAINTLVKLQEITSTLAGESAGAEGFGSPSSAETSDGSIPPPLDEPNGDPRYANTIVASVPGAGREPPRLAASQSFGRYQITRLLGRGAMGAVYLAYDPQLERYVALKTPFLGDNPQIIARFFREARAAARLRSPYTCPVYDVGQIGGIYYLSMAFIEGQSLEKVIAAGRWKDDREPANLTKKIARGLQTAHDHGIIHRDLKPENIMIDGEGEPIVMDFGLAKRVDDEIQVTTPGKVIGTPAYMSPEQVEGDPSKIGPLTDIYSLGVVLYRILTGRLPFEGSLVSVLGKIAKDEPPRPSAINPAIGEHSGLEGICLKMMAKSPEGRFSSMAEVVEALEALSTREITPAARPSVLSRLWSWLRRIFAFRARSENSAVASVGNSNAKTLPDSDQVTLGDPKDVQDCTQTLDPSVMGNTRNT